jgi:hypothetical protein
MGVEPIIAIAMIALDVFEERDDHRTACASELILKDLQAPQPVDEAVAWSYTFSLSEMFCRDTSQTECEFPESTENGWEES